MRIFKTRYFSRFARRENIRDEKLVETILRAEKGGIDARLGGGLIKQRVARTGSGRSGGYRTIIAWRAEDRAIFLYGFAKNERDNIDETDLERLRNAARELLSFSERDIDAAVEAGKLTEIEDEKTLPQQDRRRRP